VTGATACTGARAASAALTAGGVRVGSAQTKVGSPVLSSREATCPGVPSGIGFSISRPPAWNHNKTVVAVGGEIDVSTCDAFEQELARAIAERAPDGIVVDLSRVTFMDSSALNALVRDDLTGDLFVANDFGVLRREAKSGHWHVAAKGMPMVEVSSLAIDSTNRVLYAATHGRSAFRLRLGSANRGNGAISAR